MGTGQADRRTKQERDTAWRQIGTETATAQTGQRLTVEGSQADRATPDTAQDRTRGRTGRDDMNRAGRDRRDRQTGGQMTASQPGGEPDRHSQRYRYHTAAQSHTNTNTQIYTFLD